MICYTESMQNNYIGQKIRELRLDKGLSQRQLGVCLGFCNQTISFWESGKREPDLDSVIKIAQFFDVTLDYLVGVRDY